MEAVRATIESVLAIDPGAEALEFEGRWASWGQLARTQAALRGHLATLGRSGRVAVFMRNRPEILCATLACIAEGQCLVTINPVYPDDQVAEDLSAVAAPVIIASARDWARPAVAAAAVASGALCLEVAGLEVGGEVCVKAGPSGPLAEFPRAFAPGVAVEMLTSGTTGKPKRIPLEAAAYEKALLGAALFEGGRKADDPAQLRSGVSILTNGFAHTSGLMGSVGFVLAGRKACLLDRFRVSEFADALRRHRPKVAGAPPAALRMLMDARPDPDTFSSLLAFRTGTAPLDPDLADAFYETYGVPVLQNYGATEFGGVAGWTMPDFKAHRLDKRGSVGRLNPGVEGRAVELDTHEPLEPGSPGVLQLKGPRIGDGVNWLTTTDLAIVDADRFVFILGRADNAIIRGGFKVHAEDVIKALQEHPAVLEAAVVGVADVRLGQAPVAACVLRNGAAATAEELLLFARGRLAPYQIPTRLKVVEDLPRTTSMKVSQPELRALFTADQNEKEGETA
ncbi:MAG TPA: class I adenylate-forming enzyme family protein, partial [Caulobacteraceae bacterium]|jgi:acyl-coenzyme A synthetase/AMP-(fatty) acid ligase|nr:class I adenylate-forming enzyme family protein [Caulobacteraceae bacterium]